ncbi:MAG: hypothetical protein KC416_12565, partial [Myxococcales bacterium]|nr:hypothetical protein [Myxococcales bacterium]
VLDGTGAPIHSKEILEMKILVSHSWMAFVLVLGFATTAGAQERSLSAEELASTPNPFKFEPTAAETVRKALEYFRVSPEAFDHLRSAAQSRAILPTIATGYRFYDLDIDQGEIQAGTGAYTQDGNRNDRYNSITVGAIWDFRQLVFNPAEVQVYGLVGVQRDVMLEVVRTFFLRRQLVLRLALQPPQEPLARASLELRIDEFTAILDVLTGAWFSEESTRRRERSRRRAFKDDGSPAAALDPRPAKF